MNQAKRIVRGVSAATSLARSNNNHDGHHLPAANETASPARPFDAHAAVEVTIRTDPRRSRSTSRTVQVRILLSASGALALGTLLLEAFAHGDAGCRFAPGAIDKRTLVSDIWRLRKQATTTGLVRFQPSLKAAGTTGQGVDALHRVAHLLPGGHRPALGKILVLVVPKRFGDDGGPAGFAGLAERRREPHGHPSGPPAATSQRPAVLEPTVGMEHLFADVELEVEPGAGPDERSRHAQVGFAKTAHIKPSAFAFRHSPCSA